MGRYATEARCRLYQLLAEALAETPSWMVHDGNQWPLYQAALAVADAEGDADLYQAALRIAMIPSENLRTRRRRCQRVMSSSHSELNLSESLAREGKITGTFTFAVWAVYQSVGLEVTGDMLPDHVSVELAFMSFLLKQEFSEIGEALHWRRARKLFVRRHAGQWLPALGDALSADADPVYGVLGAILAAAIRSESGKPRPVTRRASFRLPIVKPDLCSLCGFCVQACPTRALALRENEDFTTLVMDDRNCLSCAKCVAICPNSALDLHTTSQGTSRRELVSSQRCRCPRCGEPTVSQAEIAAIAEQIGRPVWLDYCSDCRSVM